MIESTNILVVDDIAPNIRLVAGLLGPEGFEVSFANSGKKALDQVLDNDFDLILLDIMMPDMDGISLCKAIKSHPDKADIPIIFLTGKTDEVSIAEAFEAGGVDYLYKPFNPVELVARVKTHLELKRAREALTQTNHDLQEALRLKNQFLSLASHDLRNSLGAVHGFLKLVVRDQATSLSPQSREYMDKIQQNTRQMMDLISTFLDTAALEMGRIELKPKFLNLVEAIRPQVEAYQRLAADKQQSLTLDTSSDEIWLLADRGRLNQIVDNLLSNAVKYSPYGGAISIALSDQKDHVEIRVSDQGPGFSAEDKDRIFGYFTRLGAKPTGGESSTGVGLALTRQIVELHGGRISLESEPGQGAVFLVELPKKEEAAF